MATVSSETIPQSILMAEPTTEQESQQSSFLTQLKNLSSSIESFHNCYADLQTHLDLIQSAISSKLQSQIPPSKPLNITHLPLPLQHDKTKTTELELQSLFKTMNFREIRKHVITHLSDLTKLRQELPILLKLAPNAPKLVLDCLGKFFLQGKNAFTRNSAMIPSREASLFVLECFLLMECGEVEIEEGVREEAENSALLWRKRLVVEGGLRDANEVDARGVLMLVAGFGIPKAFRKEDVKDLVRVVGRGKEVAGLLKRSKVFMDKIAELVEWMTKGKKKVDAVDIVYTFGLEEKFDPQIILVSYLEESTESSEKLKNASRRSAAALNESNKKLDALKSVRTCLQTHKIDPANLLPGWQIAEKISSLEKEVATSSRKSDEKPNQKRKAKESHTPSKSNTKEPKRSHYSNQRSSPHQHATTRFVNYSASPSVSYGGPGAGLHPESMISTNPYAREVHGGILVDSVGQVLNRSQGYVYDAELVEKYVNQPSSGLTGLYRGSALSGGVPRSPLVGHVSRSSGSDLYHFADSVEDRDRYGSSVSHGVGVGSNSLPGHQASYVYRV